MGKRANSHFKLLSISIALLLLLMLHLSLVTCRIDSTADAADNCSRPTASEPF